MRERRKFGIALQRGLDAYAAVTRWRHGTRRTRILYPCESGGAFDMRQLIDRVFYYATAPVRLFATSRRFRLIVGGIVVVAVCFKATLWALDSFLPQDSDAKQAVPTLPQLPALEPVTRSSYVI